MLDTVLAVGNILGAILLIVLLVADWRPRRQGWQSSVRVSSVILLLSSVAFVPSQYVWARGGLLLAAFLLGIDGLRRNFRERAAVQSKGST